jgi:hypothetical protein
MTGFERRGSFLGSVFKASMPKPLVLKALPSITVSFAISNVLEWTEGG